MDKNGVETRKIFEQIMLRFDFLKGIGVGGTKSSGSFDAKQKLMIDVATEGGVASSGRTEHIDLSEKPRGLT